MVVVVVVMVVVMVVLVPAGLVVTGLEGLPGLVPMMFGLVVLPGLVPKNSVRYDVHFRHDVLQICGGDYPHLRTFSSFHSLIFWEDISWNFDSCSHDPIFQAVL